jgi:hypothetical protein
VLGVLEALDHEVSTQSADRHLRPVCRRGQDVEHRVRHGEPGHDGSAGLHDARLLPGDRRACRPEDRGVLEIDVGQDRNRRNDDVRRIEPTAEPDFMHRPFDGAALELEECGQSDPLEERRELERRSLVRRREDRVRRAQQTFVVDRSVVDGDALFHALQVRRRVQTHARTARPQHARHERGRGPLPFRARDVDDRRGTLRLTEAPHELHHPREVRAYAPRVERRHLLVIGARAQQSVELRAVIHSTGSRQVRPRMRSSSQGGRATIAAPPRLSMRRLASCHGIP